MKYLLRFWAWFVSFINNIPDDNVPATPAPYDPAVRRAVDSANAYSDFRRRGLAHVRQLRAFYSRRPRPWRMRNG